MELLAGRVGLQAGVCATRSVRSLSIPREHNSRAPGNRRAMAEGGYIHFARVEQWRQLHNSIDEAREFRDHCRGTAARSRRVELWIFVGWDRLVEW